MADPITIIGLVSGIIIFVEFSFKIVNGEKQMRDSGKGMTQELTELDSIVENIQTFNKLVKGQIPRGQKLSDDEQRISHMVNDCDILCAQLSVLMRKFTTRNSSFLGSVLVTSKSAFKRGEIQDLKRRLESLSQQIGITLQYDLQGDRHTSIMSKLREVEILRQELGVEQNTKLDALKAELAHLAKECQEQSREHQEIQAIILESLITNLDSLRREHVTILEQVRVLESLYFTKITRRFDMIPDADERTNEWVYDTTKTGFTQWVESTKQNDGLFYIIGKGSDMQKSGTGLFQALLYQILRAAPEIASEIGEGHLHHEAEDKRTLKKAFDHITRQVKLDSPYCFFIDGFDEYDGDENDVVEMLMTLSFSGHIKICTSRRPLRTYEALLYNSGLQERGRTFNIANFTKNDMRVSVNKRLYESKFKYLAYNGVEGGEMNPICKSIINVISEWADWVWLWVSSLRIG
ncbi:hypothetical protein J1614_010908 [Plenodomus biglobosus]|nr:hypothetical protein J1614_010908 [Plenodomus biglobosus]